MNTVEQVRQERVEMGTTGRFRVAVVADTHSRPHPQALDLLAQHAPHLILHAGDIGDLSVLDAIAEVAPLIPVRGNIDGTDDGLPDHVHLTFTRDGVPCARWFLTHIAVRGPKLMKRIALRAHEKSAQLVVCGHSHVPLIGTDRGLAVFNPGSIGPRRFRLPITFGLIDLDDTGINLTHWDCETGAQWRPMATARR